MRDYSEYDLIELEKKIRDIIIDNRKDRRYRNDIPERFFDGLLDLIQSYRKLKESK